MAFSGNARVRKDLVKLANNNYPVMFRDCALAEQEIVFITLFRGVKNSLYGGGIWYVKFFVPKAYPDKAPALKFLNRIYHPNIDDPSGVVCMDVLNDKWQANFDFVMVLEYFLPQLLVTPNADYGLNWRASIMYTLHPEKYLVLVGQFVAKYGNADVLSLEELATMEQEQQIDMEHALVAVNNFDAEEEDDEDDDSDSDSDSSVNTDDDMYEDNGAEADDDNDDDDDDGDDFDDDEDDEDDPFSDSSIDDDGYSSTSSKTKCANSDSEEF